MEHLKCPKCGNSSPADIRVIHLPIFRENEFLFCEKCANLYKVKE